MRRYDEPVEVQPGLVPGWTGDAADVAEVEGPAQLLWRDQLWVVREIHAHWAETGAWWDGPAARAVRGETSSPSPAGADLLTETEVWRVAAVNGRHRRSAVLELTYGCTTGDWRVRTVMD